MKVKHSRLADQVTQAIVDTACLDVKLNTLPCYATCSTTHKLSCAGIIDEEKKVKHSQLADQAIMDSTAQH